MATVLEECTTEAQRPVVLFLCAKGLNAEDIHKEIFPFYVGNFCRVKRFHVGGKCFANDEEVETEMTKWPRQQSRLTSICCGFRRTGNAKGQVCRC
jgi:hypothetical protein